MGCLFPKAEDLRQFWASIRNRVDAITDIPSTHWRPEDYWSEDPKSPDRTYARRGGFLTPVDFPLLDFGMAPHAIEATDTTQLLGLLVAREALRDAGYGPDRDFARDRVSVILGVTGTLELVIPLGARLGHPIWRRALEEAGVDGATAEDVVRRISGSYVNWQENSFPGLLGNVVAGRIATRLDLRGTNCVVDAACASSLGAVNLALLELAAGRCDIALSGGLDTFNDVFMYMCFSKTPALSPTGDARPFDAAADGTILGEGLGILVLKRLEDARRDGDRIYAVIRSMGTSSDGKGQAVYAPSADGQVRALRQAYELAGVSPGQVELIEAHGTGTKVGDAIELEALQRVFRDARPASSWCALGSIKSQVGHTKAAAGAAGLIKAALALYHKVLPPSIKVRQPIEPLASGSSPFYLNVESRPWLSGSGHPRRAGVSAFGFGGSNFHCLLEEADGRPEAIDWDGDVQILAYSGDDRDTLAGLLPSFSAETTWTAVRQEGARSRAAFRSEHKHRMLLIARRGRTQPARLVEEAAGRLRAMPQAGLPNSSMAMPLAPAAQLLEARAVTIGSGPPPGSLAMLFPGQGAQYVGMFRDLACRFPRMLEAIELFTASADGAMRQLGERIYPPATFREEERKRQHDALRETLMAQPAIGAVSLGLYYLLGDFGVEPALTGGHSFGELLALFAAGRIDERALVTLSVRRGALMAACAQSDDPSGMLAVFAAPDQVAKLLQQHALDLVIANENAPAQCVLSGPIAEIGRAAELLSAAKITTSALAVAAAFHSRFVASAASPLRETLSTVAFAPARIPVFANATAETYPEPAGEARELLASQLARPVRFVSQVEAIYRSGARTFLEVGPGARLSGMVAAILEGRAHQTVAVDASCGEGDDANLADLASALARLAALGYPVNLSRWDEGFEATTLASPRSRLSVKVCGANATAPRLKGPGKATAHAADSAPADGPSPASQSLLPAQAPAVVDGPPGIGPSALLPAQAPAARIPHGVPSSSTNLPSEWTMTLPQRNSHPAPNGQPAPPAYGAARPDRDGSCADLHSSTRYPAASELARAVDQTQENLLALQRLAEQTAQLHRQFLDGQAAAQQTFHALFLEHQKLTNRSLGQSRAEEVRPPEDEHRDLAPSASAFPGTAPLATAKDDFPAPDRHAAGAARNGDGSATARAPGLSQAVPSLAAAPPATTPPAAARILLEIVADKTGYPPEMLELDMQLDADLGIDSIKRVEILSAVQDRIPEAHVVGPEQIGTLRTLRQIAQFLQGESQVQVQPSGEPAPPVRNGDVHSPAPADRLAPLASGAAAVADVLLNVVADKTGYPPEMLELDMQLDADLGIDSIKRVEILSAVQDRIPEAPVVGPEQIGTLRTLRQIAEFLDRKPQPVAFEPIQLADGQVLDCWTPRAVPLSTPDLREPAAIAQGSEIWICDDGSLLAPALRANLERLGHHVRLIAPQGSPLPDPALNLGALIILTPSEAAGTAFIPNAFRLVRAAGPALRRQGARGGSALVCVLRLDGSFGFGQGGTKTPVDATGGALAGLVKCAQQEWPEVHCKALDVGPCFDSAQATTERIVQELFRRGPAEVGLSDSARQAIELFALPGATRSSRREPLLVPGELVLASGGARGITAEVAVALARSLRPRLALLGRTPAPQAEPPWLPQVQGETALRRAIRDHAGGPFSPSELNDKVKAVLAQREIRRNLDRIAAAGSEVSYHAVDVRDRALVRELVEKLKREQGPVRGLVHGAGVLADRHIEDQTDLQFAQVFETKVEGLLGLVDGVELDGLRFLALFSSSSARFGRVGQAAYAAANEWLNKWAQRSAKEHPQCRVVAFNWGPWDGGMVTAALKPMFQREGLGLIQPADGARLLVEEIQAGGDRPVEIVVLARPDAPGKEPLAHGQGNGHAAVTGEARDTRESDTMEPVFERRIDLDSLPVLRCHVIDGHAVLPLALILEWLAEGALHRHPGMVVRGLDNLRLYKGLVLRGGRPADVSIRAGKLQRRGELRAIPVELLGLVEGGRQIKHARAEVVIADGHGVSPNCLDQTSLPLLETDRDEIYGRILFHGPALQAIERVEGCSEHAIAGWVSTAPAPSAWTLRPLRQNWLTDPLAIDAAFQLLVLWTRQRLGSSSLPTAVGSYRQFRRAFPSEGVRVRAVVREVGDRRATADIDFADAQGNLVARIEAYECVIDASLNQAFRRNRLSELEVASSS